MALILRIERRRLGSRVKSLFESTESGNVNVYVPALVLAEIFYLSEKQRIHVSLPEVVEYLTRYPSYKEYPMSFAVIQAAAEITDVPELEVWVH
jgi:predicted nucleic acid-binding protein